MSNRDSQYDPVVLESELKGKTLLVYWYLIQQSSHAAGAREIQRALRFSSPSIAVHHLEKLQDLGLVEKRGTGEYLLAEEVKVGILRFFMRMGRFVVPRYLFYSILLSTMLITYLVLCVISQVIPSFYAIVFGAIGSFLFWFETIRLWRAKPI